MATQPTNSNGNDKKQGSAPAPAAAKPPTTPPPAAAATTEEPKTPRIPSRVFIAVGEVKEFANRGEAEKFLNGPDAPKEFTAIKGTRVANKNRVTLK